MNNEEFLNECIEKHKALIKEYGKNKYKSISKNGEVKYHKHRKDICLDDIKIVKQLIIPKEGLCEEHCAISKKYVSIRNYYYDENYINKVIDYNFVSIDGKVLERRIIRDRFRYEDSYGFVIMEFKKSDLYSIIYTKRDDEISVKLYIGSKYINVDILSQEDREVVKKIINSLKKDKFIDLPLILEEFNLEV